MDTQPNEIETMVRHWFSTLNTHPPVSTVLTLLSEKDLLMVFPDSILRNYDDFIEWYDEIGRTYADQHHLIENLKISKCREGFNVDLIVKWQARKISDSTALAMRAEQTWKIVKSPQGQNVIQTYVVRSLLPADETIFAHVGLACKNLETTELFYSRYFGFCRARTIGSGKDQVIFLKNKAGNSRLELFTAKEESSLAPSKGAGPEYPGYRHIAFQVENVDAKCGEMGNDAVITLGPLSFDEVIPGWRTVWVADPDGRIVEITQGYTDAR